MRRFGIMGALAAISAAFFATPVNLPPNPFPTKPTGFGGGQRPRTTTYHPMHGDRERARRRRQIERGQLRVENGLMPD